MTAPRIGRFVDVEQLVVTWLTPLLPDVRVRTRLPADITGDTVWVAYAGGTPAYDNSLLRVDLASFRPGGEGAAIPLAEQAHDAMRALEGQTVNGQPVSTIDVWSWPIPRFWSPTVDRVIGTYELDLPVLG